MVRGEHATRSAAWTRHRPPSRQNGILDRPRLTARLDAAVARERVAVVCAPSGFGKTAAVSAWAEGHRVAWLGLTAFDDDPLRVAAGVIEALQVAAREHGVVETGELAAIDPVVQDLGATYRALCEALAALDETMILVVDEAQRAAAAFDGSLLAALVESAPETLRIVLVGTTMLEVALAKQLLTRPDSLIDATDLAFDADEVAALMADGVEALTPQEVMDETAGWPIAVRVVLLGGARPRRAGVADQDAVARDYVREHVLRALSPDVAQVVLHTSVAGDLTAELAVALADRTDAADLLEVCARQGLFVDRFATSRGTVYRWHAYFARQCRAILQLEDRDLLNLLHHRAATVLSADDPLAAVSHLIAAGDGTAAAELIVRRWVGLVLGSDAGALDRLCATLPMPQRIDRRILFIRACAQDLMGEHEAARIAFAQADAAADDSDPSAVRALASLVLLDDRAAVAAATAQVRALAAELGDAFGEDRAAVMYLLAWTHMRLRSDPRRVIELLTAALREAEAVGDGLLAERVRGHLAVSLVWAGAMARARRLLTGMRDRDEDASAPWAYFAGGTAALAAGLLAYWADDRGEAELQLTRVVRSGSAAVSFGGIARFFLALSAASAKDAAWCRRAAQDLQALPRREMHGWSWPAFRLTAFAALEEVAGSRDRAVALVRKQDAAQLPVVAVVLAGILRRGNDPLAALHLLQSLRGYEEISYVRVATFATAALVDRRRGAVELTHELCERALDMAVAEGIRRPFSEGELELRQLLGEHIAWGTKHEDFIVGCLAPRGGDGPLDQLSDRERDVFEQLRTNRTMLEIAEALGVSINTVKTHQRSIYRKLGVASRREAVRLLT